MFIDTLLMEYQTNRSIDYEIQRSLMACTPFRDDFLFSKKTVSLYVFHFFIRSFLRSIGSQFYIHDYASN